MRALVYVAPESVEMRDRPRPTPAAGEKEVEIETTGICGSDMSGFLGHSPRRKPPLTLGHEMVGRLNDGRRVVANPLISCGKCARCISGAQNLCESWRLLGLDRTEGSFAEYVTLPEGQLFEIPDSLPSERAVLAEPLANVVHLFRITAPLPFFRLAIVGAGTMGALTYLGARLIGARDILVVDLNQERLNALKKMGVAAAVNANDPAALREARESGLSEFDVVIDASGTAAARQMAFDLCRPGGQVVLLGMGNQRSEVDFVTSIRKEHRVVTSFAYTPADFRRALALLIAGEVDLAPWTEKVPLEHGQRAFEKMTRAPGATLKMLLSVR
jgi:2-desacetyl-2-hydroxyethyl bacteriochlorophyllide A dehydrogenase